MWIQGKEYISSKRGSELSGYAQDYIGQLARKGLIDAQRVGGLWFISMTSLTEYKSNAETYVPQPPERKEVRDAETLVSFDGNDHVSAARAAKITGYHPDYVGQLARSGAIISRQVGNRWYVDRAAILAHKQEKDSLLGAVQAQSVGISRSNAHEAQNALQTLYNGPGPLLTYTRDDGDLLPVLSKSGRSADGQEPDNDYRDETEHVVPIRAIHTSAQQRPPAPRTAKVSKISRGRTPEKTIYTGTFRALAGAALTIVIVLSFGFATLKSNSLYSSNVTPGGSVVERNALPASAMAALQRLGTFFKELLTKEIIYKRAN